VIDATLEREKKTTKTIRQSSQKLDVFRTDEKIQQQQEQQQASINDNYIRK